jgi:uncharacterized protein (DUF983 family)
LFKPYSISVRDACGTCGFALGQHDIGDGAAVFLIFILGFFIIPLAWVFELAVAPPLWVHAVLWTVVSFGMIMLLLPATKAMIIMLEYRHRPGEKPGGGNDDRRA